ncbi:MAG: hypothetical protein ASARMPREDX12_007997 [Alectoria sarmentosa]|nr:MAG: hypothetical protein ASARMPREDX12_007997 [Alectoria sarmentosa]
MASLKASLPPFLYTKRLTLELFDYSETHYDCLLAAMNSPTAHINMGDYGVRTPAQFDALNFATRLSPSACDGRVPDTDIYYLLRKGPKSGPLMGAVSLAQRAASTPPDMGWCILEPFMGQGYAAEAGEELLRLAREELGVKEIVSWPGTRNQRSIRVAQKIGFVKGGNIKTSDGTLIVVFVLPGMVFDSGTLLTFQILYAKCVAKLDEGNTLLAWAVLAFAVLINSVASTSLAKFESLVLVLHIVGFFAILIPLTHLAPHASARDVFKTFLNAGGWDTQAYSFFIGLVGAVYAFVGADSAVHLAEEIRDAAVVIPRVILFSVGINGALGFAMLIAVLFCLGDPSLVPTTVLQTSLGFPFIQVFLDATKSVPGTAIMASIVLVLGISSTVGLLASSSRMFWSFARDRGLPFWQKISEVDRRTSIPVTAVGITTTISALLALIGIGSSVAFNDIISITVVALYASYLVATILLLWRRTTGSIHPASESSIASTIINAPNSTLIWGPFKMPHVVGILVNSVAVAYMIIVFLFAFWPPALPVGPASMNYACLVFGGTVLFSIAWYIVHARKVYQGPVVEFEH